MNFYVYILHSEKVDKYYTGHTDNIERRLKEHNTGQTRYTSQQGTPWKLVYSESFADRSSAIKREKEIKAKKSKKYIQDLIHSIEHPA